MSAELALRILRVIQLLLSELSRLLPLHCDVGVWSSVMDSAVVLVELSIATYSINAWMNAGDGGNASSTVIFVRKEIA